MTPAAKERLKDIVQSLGVDGRTRTSAPPSAVALPATAAFKTGCQRLIEGMCLGWALLAGVEINQDRLSREAEGIGGIYFVFYKTEASLLFQP